MYFSGSLPRGAASLAFNPRPGIAVKWDRPSPMHASFPCPVSFEHTTSDLVFSLSHSCIPLSRGRPSKVPASVVPGLPCPSGDLCSGRRGPDRLTSAAVSCCLLAAPPPEAPRKRVIGRRNRRRRLLSRAAGSCGVTPAGARTQRRRRPIIRHTAHPAGERCRIPVARQNSDLLKSKVVGELKVCDREQALRCRFKRSG